MTHLFVFLLGALVASIPMLALLRDAKSDAKFHKRMHDIEHDDATFWRAQSERYKRLVWFGTQTAEAPAQERPN